MLQMRALGAGNLSGQGLLLGKVPKSGGKKRPLEVIDPGLPNGIPHQLPKSNVKRVGQVTGKSPRQRIRQQLQGQNKQQRAEKRQQFASSQPCLARYQGQSFLEAQAVTPDVALDYKIRMFKFQQFAKQKKLSLKGLRDLDAAFVEFLNELFLTGTDLGDATKHMAC